MELDKRIASEILKESKIKNVSSKSLKESNTTKYVFGENEVEESEFLKIQENLNEPLIEEDIKDISEKLLEVRLEADKGEYEELLKEQVLRTGRWKK